MSGILSLFSEIGDGRDSKKGNFSNFNQSWCGGWLWYSWFHQKYTCIKENLSSFLRVSIETAMIDEWRIPQVCSEPRFQIYTISAFLGYRVDLGSCLADSTKLECLEWSKPRIRSPVEEADFTCRKWQARFRVCALIGYNGFLRRYTERFVGGSS